MEYKDYLETWINGIHSELIFWNNYMKNEGGISFYGFEKTISSCRVFELEDDIPKDFYGKKYKFIDVGSGPFSRCGTVTDKVELEALAVDPLAYGYIVLKEKYGIDNGISLENGFVELLDMHFKPNSFDMVHMSNSLDHCFSAIDGIYQLLNICKIGGKVILRHHENEADNENYQGMHQWNLSLHNDENSFIVWRNDVRCDICKIFEEYADFQLLPDVLEKGGHWIYNKVIMTKKKDVVMPSNDYYPIMLDAIYKQMILNQLTINNINEIDDISDITDMRISKIRNLYHEMERTKNKVTIYGISKVIIYGMGYVGKNLDYLLESLGVEVIKLDIREADCGCIDAVSMNDCPDWNADRIITTIDDVNIIKELIHKAVNSESVITIDYFLELLEE